MSIKKREIKSYTTTNYIENMNEHHILHAHSLSFLWSPHAYDHWTYKWYINVTVSLN